MVRGVEKYREAAGGAGEKKLANVQGDDWGAGGREKKRISRRKRGSLWLHGEERPGIGSRASRILTARHPAPAPRPAGCRRSAAAGPLGPSLHRLVHFRIISFVWFTFLSILLLLTRFAKFMAPRKLLLCDSLVVSFFASAAGLFVRFSP